LLSQKYLDIVYDGSLDNMESKFALYDASRGTAHEAFSGVIKVSRSSLSSADKKVVRDSRYAKKVV